MRGKYCVAFVELLVGGWIVENKLYHHRCRFPNDSPLSTAGSRGWGLVGGASHGPDLLLVTPLANTDAFCVAWVGAAKVLLVDPCAIWLLVESLDDILKVTSIRNLLRFYLTRQGHKKIHSQHHVYVLSSKKKRLKSEKEAILEKVLNSLNSRRRWCLRFLKSCSRTIFEVL